MQNTIHSLEDLFAVNTFRIPQYQRAYSWEEDPHLEAFLEDLRQQVSTQKKSPNKHYFLGTFLLHEEDIGGGRKAVNIVDGQQRMTTSVAFIATALALHTKGKISFANEKPALLRRNFVHDQDTESQKFHTIQEDEPFFQSAILGISSATCNYDTPSARRLQAAADYFTKKVATDEWEPLLYDEPWGNDVHRYLDFQGFRYWTMGFVMSVTIIINRCELGARSPHPFSDNPQMFYAKPASPETKLYSPN